MKSPFSTVISRQTRVSIVIFLTSAFFFVELVVGYITGSLALIADSFHLLSDVLSLVVGLYAIRLAARKSYQVTKLTYGYQRAEILGALVNAIFLVALCFSIFVDAIHRFAEIEEVRDPLFVCYVGIAGLVVNIAGLFLFHEHGHGHGHSHGHHHHGHSHADEDKKKEKSKKAKGLLSTIPEQQSTQDLDIDLESQSNSNSHTRAQTPTHPLTTKVQIIEAARKARRQSSDSHSHRSSIHDISSTPGAIVPGKESPPTHHHHHGSLNMHGMFLHVLGDALGSVAVIISSLVIYFGQGDWKYYIDPLCSLIIVIIIMTSTYPLIRSALYILLQGVPTNIPYEDLKRDIESLEGVLGVHEFHVWQLNDSKTIASVHVRVENVEDVVKDCWCRESTKPEEQSLVPKSKSADHEKFHQHAKILKYMEIAKAIKTLLHGYGIHSTTIQPEFYIPVALLKESKGMEKDVILELEVEVGNDDDDDNEDDNNNGNITTAITTTTTSRRENDTMEEMIQLQEQTLDLDGTDKITPVSKPQVQKEQDTQEPMDCLLKCVDEGCVEQSCCP